MNKRIFFIIVFLFLFIYSIGNATGYLVIIGGGNRTEEIMKKIIELGGKAPKVLIIPNASSEPTETAQRLVEEFTKLGIQSIKTFFGDRDKANDNNYVKQFADCNIVFFSGGDQNRLTKDLLNTKLLDLIKLIYYSGGVISGTSAGAAVMSKMMITGDEYKNKDSSNPFSTIETGNVAVAEGFGFLEDVIIDQHFIKRKRLNRLISLVIENSDKLGIGIDESTAIVVYPDRTFEVIGESQVIVFDTSKSPDLRENERDKIGGSNIIMHILLPKQKFDLNTKRVLR
ncbi:MAG: cyanophycinase [Ignavibacteria bacterium]|nr:cyanophycinase [Ignavibacteria bacterium]